MSVKEAEKPIPKNYPAQIADDVESLLKMNRAPESGPIGGRADQPDTFIVPCEQLTRHLNTDYLKEESREKAAADGGKMLT